MIQEAYCSFDVSKLLEEKGFNEPTWTCYIEHEISHYDYTSSNSELIGGVISAPTHQMAMKWLREVHQLHISVDVSPIYGKVKDEKGRNTCGLLYWHYMASGEWTNEKYNPQQKAFVMSAKRYEDAVEAALKYVLENLI